jgi:mono/diheme cytochrome c family protein
MKFAIALFVALLSAVPLASSAQDEAPKSDASAPALLDSDDPKQVYDQMCAGCHGYRGDGGEGHRGGFSPHIGTLANKEYMASLPDDYLVLIIKKGGAYMGKIATMPGWEKKLSDNLIHKLVAHIRTFTGTTSLKQ